MASRRPGQRAGLSRQAVLAAARELLESDGIDGLSMRALARRLEVAPNALYGHVESKLHLLDEVLDDLLALVQSPPPDAGDPVGAVRELMTSTYETLTAHPDLVPLYLARQGARGANAVHLGEVLDTLLGRAGVAPAEVPAARRALIVHAIGFAAFAIGEVAIPAAAARDGFVLSLQWLLRGIVAGTSGT